MNEGNYITRNVTPISVVKFRQRYAINASYFRQKVIGAELIAIISVISLKCSQSWDTGFLSMRKWVIGHHLRASADRHFLDFWFQKLAAFSRVTYSFTVLKAVAMTNDKLNTCPDLKL